MFNIQYNPEKEITVSVLFFWCNYDYVNAYLQFLYRYQINYSVQTVMFYIIIKINWATLIIHP